MLPFTLPDGRQVIVVLREQLPEAVRRLIAADAEPAAGVVERLLARLVEKRLGPAPRPANGNFDSSSAGVAHRIAHDAEIARERREQRRRRRDAPKQYQPRKRKKQHPRCPRCAACPCARGFDPLTYNPMDEPNAIHDMARRWSKEQAAKERAKALATKERKPAEPVESVPPAGRDVERGATSPKASVRTGEHDRESRSRGVTADVSVADTVIPLPTSAPAERTYQPAGRDVERRKTSPATNAPSGTHERPSESPRKPDSAADGLQIRPTARGDPES
ncbi:MAG: hypothetical protein WD066_15835 [Planctomycetaceae bacterium]